MGIGILIGVLIIPALIGLLALVLTGIFAIPYYYFCIKTYFLARKENKSKKQNKVVAKVNDDEVKENDGE